MTTRFLIRIALLAGLLGGGCTVGPHYAPPTIKSAPAFGELNSSVTTNEPVGEWWHEFHDEELDHLISEALSSNYDLQIATLRIRESRWQRNIAAAVLFPTVDAGASYAHSRGSQNVVLPLGGSSQSGSSQSGQTKAASQPRLDAADPTGGGSSFGANPLGTPPSPFGQGGLPGVTSDLYQVGFDASWEIDVFGGKRRLVEAANAELGAAAEGRHDLQVSLAAEVARDYLELRGGQERLRIARENLGTAEEVLKLTKSKSNVGLASDLDAVRAAAEAAATAAAMPTLEANCRRYMHALAILVGKEPNELGSELTPIQPMPTTPPEVPVGLPSQLLKRRPDIKQAERQIAAANARIGNAEADLFPQFALIGNAGLDSTSPDKLFDWGSRYFLISPTVSWRIFDAGRIMANVQLQRANEQEAVWQYKSTILKALREVEDALVAYANEEIRHNDLAEQLKQDQEALDLAKKRYDQGLTDFLSVLDAERSVFSAQDEVTQSNQSVTTDLVALYKSLGGGWK